MSYDNAGATPLKFLVSNGDLVDEAGNVIAHSDSLKDVYDKASPQVKKFLFSDGSVVDENNNLIIKNDYFKKVYDQANPKVAKYLHADGTIDENPGSGGGSEASESKVNLYGWTIKDNDSARLYFDFDIPPESFNGHKYFMTTGMTSSKVSTMSDVSGAGFSLGWSKVSDTEISYTHMNGGGGGGGFSTTTTNYVRKKSMDVTVW